jgi:hypothetical protein
MSDDCTGGTSFKRQTSWFASRMVWMVEFETQWSAKNRRAIRRQPQIRPVLGHSPNMRRSSALLLKFRFSTRSCSFWLLCSGTWPLAKPLKTLSRNFPISHWIGPAPDSSLRPADLDTLFVAGATAAILSCCIFFGHPPESLIAMVRIK